MKSLFKLHANGSCRKTLITFVLVGQFTELALGCLCCIVAILVKTFLIYKMSFFGRYYNSWVVPTVLMITGIAMMLTSIFGIKFCYKCFRNKPGFTKIKSISTAHYFFIMNFITLISKAATVLVFVHELQIIHSALKKGIADAIRLYRSDSVIKEELDVIQMKYGCCGLESYKDWFHIKWVEDKYTKDRLEKSTKNIKNFVDDVPFSCCDKTIKFPCVNERVIEEKAHYGYDYSVKLTLYKNGCLQTLWNFYRKPAFMKISIFLLMMICFQISLAVVARLLQTSLISSWNGEELAIGSMISFSPEDPGIVFVEDKEDGNE